MVRKINDVAVLKFTVDGKDFEKACKVLSIYIEDENKKMRIMENEHFKQESYLDDNGKTILAVGHGIINKVIQAVFYSKRMSDIPRMENAEVRTLFIE